VPAQRQQLVRNDLWPTRSRRPARHAPPRLQPRPQVLLITVFAARGRPAAHSSMGQLPERPSTFSTQPVENPVDESPFPAPLPLRYREILRFAPCWCVAAVELLCIRRVTKESR